MHTGGLTVAKAKGKSRSQDRHAGGFMLRLPQYLREPVDTLRKRTRRTLTTEIAICVEERLKAEGIPFTPPAE